MSELDEMLNKVLDVIDINMNHNQNSTDIQISEPLNDDELDKCITILKGMYMKPDNIRLNE